MENKFIKLTENNFYNENYDYYDFLCKRVKTFLIGNACDFQICLEESLINCDSPIEQILSIYLSQMSILQINEYNPYIDVLSIEKQFKIGKYRVDFMIPVEYKNQGIINFIIECDGYEFHQKTKEQVEHDNERQRFFQKQGYEVIRFSGSEIYNNPRKCVEEIKNIILSKCKYLKGDK